MKAAPDMIVDSTGGHFAQCRGRDFQNLLVSRPSVIAKQETDGRLARKLWGHIQPAIFFIEAILVNLNDVMKNLRVGKLVSHLFRRKVFSDRLGELI